MNRSLKALIILVIFFAVLPTTGYCEEVAKPNELTLMETDGTQYLVDEKGDIYSYLLAPDVKVNFKRQGFVIRTNFNMYMPVQKYDGFLGVFSVSNPRAEQKTTEVLLGARGGFVPASLASSPPFYRLSVVGYIEDRRGEIFYTPSTDIHYSNN